MIAFDIDGVIADARHREHHLTGGRRDWKSFFAAADEDAVIDAGLHAVLQALERDDVVLVSGRPERLRDLTQGWLTRHGFPPLPLHLRDDADRRPAAVIKEALLEALGGPAVVTEVHDDDPAVVAALRTAGYSVVHVAHVGEVS